MASTSADGFITTHPNLSFQIEANVHVPSGPRINWRPKNLATGTQIQQDDNHDKEEQPNVIGISVLFSIRRIGRQKGCVVRVTHSHSQITSAAFVIIDGAAYRAFHDFVYNLPKKQGKGIYRYNGQTTTISDFS